MDDKIIFWTLAFQIDFCRIHQDSVVCVFTRFRRLRFCPCVDVVKRRYDKIVTEDIIKLRAIRIEELYSTFDAIIWGEVGFSVGVNIYGRKDELYFLSRFRVSCISTFFTKNKAVRVSLIYFPPLRTSSRAARPASVSSGHAAS